MQHENILDGVTMEFSQFGGEYLTSAIISTRMV
jgi:hypothetical protein